MCLALTKQNKTNQNKTKIGKKLCFYCPYVAFCMYVHKWNLFTLTLGCNWAAFGPLPRRRIASWAPVSGQWSFLLRRTSQPFRICHQIRRLLLRRRNRRLLRHFAGWADRLQGRCRRCRWLRQIYPPTWTTYRPSSCCFFAGSRRKVFFVFLTVVYVLGVHIISMQTGEYMSSSRHIIFRFSDSFHNSIFRKFFFVDFLVSPPIHTYTHARTDIHARWGRACRRLKKRSEEL